MLEKIIHSVILIRQAPVIFAIGTLNIAVEANGNSKNYFAHGQVFDLNILKILIAERTPISTDDVIIILVENLAGNWSFGRGLAQMA
jgi:hypothetical protein